MIDCSKQEIKACKEFEKISEGSTFILCKFHIFKSWLSHLNKYNQSDRNNIFKYLRLLTMSNSDEEFNEIYNKFIINTKKINNIIGFITYFEQCYIPIKSH